MKSPKSQSVFKKWQNQLEKNQGYLEKVKAKLPSHMRHEVVYVRFENKTLRVLIEDAAFYLAINAYKNDIIKWLELPISVQFKICVVGKDHAITIKDQGLRSRRPPQSAIKAFAALEKTLQDGKLKMMVERFDKCD